MRQFLRKRWFLLVLVGSLFLAWAEPASVRVVAGRLEERAVVAIALLLMSLSLEGRRLLDSVRRPWPALWAVAVSYGMLPAFAWWAGSLLGDPALRVGILIIASVPCTLASAVIWTRMGGGNEATALLVIVLTTATSWLVTTAWLVWGTRADLPLDAGKMISDLFLVLVVPVGLGQGLRASAAVARSALRFRAFLGVIAELLILSIILKAAADVFARLREAETPPSLQATLAALALCVTTHLAALAFGYWTSKGLGFDRPNRIAVAIAGSQKTLPVALVVFGYFKDSYPLAILPLVLYHVSQLVVDTFIADAMRKRSRPTIDTAKQG